MSHPAASSPQELDVGGFPETHISGYGLLSRTIDAVTREWPPGWRSILVSQYLGRSTRNELRVLFARPEWLRAILLQQGHEVLTRLLKENWEHVGTSKIITELYGVPPSTLHRDKDRGAVIAYRPADTTEFLFPFEQFAAGGIRRDWAGALVSVVGNGAPALQFLYVKRRSLAGRSFAEALRAGDSEETNTILLSAIERLAAD